MLHFSPFVRVLCLSLSGVKLGHSIVLLLRGAKGSHARARILFLFLFYIFVLYFIICPFRVPCRARIVSHFG